MLFQAYSLILTTLEKPRVATEAGWEPGNEANPRTHHTHIVASCGSIVPGTPAFQHTSHTSCTAASGTFASKHTIEAPSNTAENLLTCTDKRRSVFTRLASLPSTCSTTVFCFLTDWVQSGDKARFPFPPRTVSRLGSHFSLVLYHG